MTECANETMRDRLPLLAQDALSAEESALVRSHLATCAGCASELELLRAAAALFAAATPRVDVAAIVAKLPASPGRPMERSVERAVAQPPLTLVRPVRPLFGLPRYVLAAAASFALVAAVAIPAVLATFQGRDASIVGAVDSERPVALVAPAAFVGGADLADLGTDELTALLAELDRMEATVAVEPLTMRQPLGPWPEGI